LAKTLAIYSQILAILHPIKGQSLAFNLFHAVCDLPQATLGCPIARNGGHVRWKVAAIFAGFTPSFVYYTLTPYFFYSRFAPF